MCNMRFDCLYIYIHIICMYYIVQLNFKLYLYPTGPSKDLKPPTQDPFSRLKSYCLRVKI